MNLIGSTIESFEADPITGLLERVALIDKNGQRVHLEAVVLHGEDLGIHVEVD